MIKIIINRGGYRGGGGRTFAPPWRISEKLLNSTKGKENLAQTEKNIYLKKFFNQPIYLILLAIPFHIQSGIKIDHQDQSIFLSSLRVRRRENPRKELNTTNLLALNSWNIPWRFAISSVPLSRYIIILKSHKLETELQCLRDLRWKFNKYLVRKRLLQPLQVIRSSEWDFRWVSKPTFW